VAQSILILKLQPTNDLEWRGICSFGAKVPIIIENAEVVSKSYPDFWEDLKSLGFNIAELTANYQCLRGKHLSLCYFAICI
jgi:hypothetical protein